ncbi:helix-turn-helix domain-containing protein [Lysinibacillus xylanilyticus]|uniref:helix-turn-helix domain-containing protein n=1 Tax=Lysinibacillus xylanilyticus TaxID=582475 RepID=UPI003D07714E
MEIGTFIKEKRKAKSLTLRELANSINLSHSYLSQIENGQRKASPELLEKLSKVLDVEYMHLLEEAGYIRLQEYDESYIEFLNIEEFRKMEFPDIEEYLKSNQVYFSKKKLNKAHRELILKVMHALTDELEKNYPSAEEIEKLYRNIKDSTEVINNRN